MSGIALDELRAGGKRALARALADIEAAPLAPSTLGLLDAADAAAGAHVVGLTGPPGVGKSTLLSRLIRDWRAQHRTVGIIAVDPSSRRSRGALLGDRMRIDVDPEDKGVYVRSMAARERLGGVAPETFPAAVLLRALFDLVVVETVGVGQSETDVAGVCDTVVLCIQPGSGDSLQYMKAGIAEIPDVVVVNKADLGTLAETAARDVEAALGIGPAAASTWTVPVVAASATTGRGVDELRRHIDAHAAHLDARGRRRAQRREQAERWLEDALKDAYGRTGLARAHELGGDQLLPEGASPFARLAGLSRALNGRAARP